MRPPNILHVCNSYSNTIGGAERVVRYLHQGLNKINFSSSLVGLYHNNLSNDLIDKASTLSKGSTPYKLYLIWNLLLYIKKNSNETTIIHAHLFPTILYIALFKRLGLIKNVAIVTEHSTSNNRRIKWYGALLDRFIFRSYDAVAAISQGVANSLNSRSIVPISFISVIENGVPLPEKRLFKREAVEKECYNLVSIGSLRAAKNYYKVIEALALLKQNNWTYTIAGEGDLKDELSLLLKEKNLEKKVHLVGRVDPIEPLLNEADIFIMASSWEGFGLAAVEAMNACLPLVVSKIPGLSELVMDSEQQAFHFAVFVNPESVLSIRDGIESMILNFKQYASHTNLAYERSLKFSQETMVDNYKQLYLKVKY